MEIHIGSANKEDAFVIAKGLPDFFNAHGLMTLSEDLENHELRGSFAEDKLVGFITLRKADIGSLEISWLAINKDFQGLGIGSRLVKETLNDFFKQGFRICYVKTLAETIVDEGYTKTRKFYKKLGFNTLEIIDPYPGWSVGNPCQILAAPLPLTE
jgi:ribosomal protein S18 acetylase RimI-like enzyme